jgi:hypothetical protein
MSITIDLGSYSKLATGGAPFGAGGRNVEYLLVCPTCAGRYPMARDPIALALSPEGATVLVGYVEVCPLCNAGHEAGAVMEVEL